MRPTTALRVFAATVFVTGIASIVTAILAIQAKENIVMATSLFITGCIQVPLAVSLYGFGNIDKVARQTMRISNRQRRIAELERQLKGFGTYPYVCTCGHVWLSVDELAAQCCPKCGGVTTVRYV